MGAGEAARWGPVPARPSWEAWAQDSRRSPFSPETPRSRFFKTESEASRLPLPSNTVLKRGAWVWCFPTPPYSLYELPGTPFPTSCSPHCNSV